jgi:hypothetical protein
MIHWTLVYRDGDDQNRGGVGGESALGPIGRDRSVHNSLQCDWIVIRNAPTSYGADGQL